MTESSGIITCENPDDNKSFEHTGYPLCCNEVRLIDALPLSYSIKDRVHGTEIVNGTITKVGMKCLGRGEIQFRGYNRSKGYYKNKELTDKYISEDGWFSTGDIGMWSEDGRLKIIDRKSNIIKLSQGEYVSIEKIEYVRNHLD